MKTNIRLNNKGITLISLVITIILMAIIAGVSIVGTSNYNKKAIEIKQMDELKMVQHSALERYTKSKLTGEVLPGEQINKSDAEEIINNNNLNITLKGTENEYKRLNQSALEELGFSNTSDTYIVNYRTGEVLNETKLKTNSGKILYTYAKDE